MTRQNLSHTFVNLYLKPIDFFFVLTHAIDQTKIALGERLHAVVDHGLNQPTHLQQLGADALKVCVKLFIGVLGHGESNQVEGSSVRRNYDSFVNTTIHPFG